MGCQRVPDAGFSPGGICTFDWDYIYAHSTYGRPVPGTDPGRTSPRLSPGSSGFVSADIKCAYNETNNGTSPTNTLSCRKSTGCSPGVCSKCCNDYIDGPACQACVEQQCNNCRCVLIVFYGRTCMSLIRWMVSLLIAQLASKAQTGWQCVLGANSRRWSELQRRRVQGLLQQEAGPDRM